MAGVGGLFRKPPQRAARGALWYNDAKWGWRASGSGLTYDGITLSAGAVAFTSLTDSGLTSGRVTFAGAGGLLTDSANLTWNGTTLAITGAASVSTTLDVTGATTLTSLTITNSALGTITGSFQHTATGGSTTATVTAQVGNSVTSQTSAGALDIILGAIETSTDIFARFRSNGSNKIMLYGDGSATFTGAISIAAGATTISGNAASVFAGTVAGDYLVKVACGSATGLGIRVQAGADGNIAYAVRNAASAISFQVLGNGAVSTTSTLGVTGATTLAALSATTGTFSSTLGVAGTSTFSASSTWSGGAFGTISAGNGRVYGAAASGLILAGNGSGTDIGLYNSSGGAFIEGVHGTNRVLLAGATDDTTTAVQVNGTFKASGVMTAKAASITGIIIDRSDAAAERSIAFLNSVVATKYNWRIGCDIVNNDALDFVPSTAVNGSTYTTAALSIAASTGTVTISNALSVTGPAASVFSGTFAGDYLVKVSNASASGLGLRVQAGADGNVALAVRNTAGSATPFTVNGSGATTIASTLDVTGGLTNLKVTDSATNSATTILLLNHASTGTPTAGFGSQILFRASSDTTADRNQGFMISEWSNVADASRKARLSLWAYDVTTARECIRMESSGTAAMLGLYGVAATTQKAGYGTPTNNVNAGSFDATTITLVNLAKHVAQLCIDLKALGAIGA